MEETPIANSDSKASSTSTSPISKPLELESIVPTHQAESITGSYKSFYFSFLPLLLMHNFIQ